MTIGAQSVRAMMPRRMFGVSGPSWAYTPPTQSCGRPAMRTPVVVAAVVLRNVRLDVLPVIPSLNDFFFMSATPLQGISGHDERMAVGRARRRLLQEGTGEDVGVARGQLQLR